MFKFPKSFLVDLALIGATVYALDKPGRHGEARELSSTLSLMIELGWIFGVSRLISESLAFFLSPPFALKASRLRFAGIHISTSRAYAKLIDLGWSAWRDAPAPARLRESIAVSALIAAPLAAIRLASYTNGRPLFDPANLASLAFCAVLTLGSLAFISVLESRVKASREAFLLALDTPAFHERWSMSDALNATAQEARELEQECNAPEPPDHGEKPGRPRL